LHLGAGRRDDRLRPGGQPGQAGAAVGGVGDAFDVAGRLELLDQEGGALLGDPGLLGELGDAGAVRADPGRHAGLGEGDVGDAGCHDGLEGALLQRPVGDEEQDPQVFSLTRFAHRARLDR
jgi:hypothetical protein